LLQNSFLAHHNDNPIFKASKENFAELFPEQAVGNNGKQENCALTVTGAIAKLSSTSRKSITMATKLLGSDSQAPIDVFALVPYHFNGKWVFVDSIGGEESSAANGHVTGLARF